MRAWSLLAVLLIAGCENERASENTSSEAALTARVSKLEGEIQELQRRVSQPPSPQPEERTEMQTWDKLLTGMKPAEVRQLVGEPDEVIDDDLAGAVANLQLNVDSTSRQPNALRTTHSEPVRQACFVWVFGSAGRDGIVVFRRPLLPGSSNIPEIRAQARESGELLYAIPPNRP